MISDPFFYLCAIPAVLLFGMAKGGLSGGLAMLAVPLMSLAISPLQAAAILLPLLLAMDAVAVWSFRGFFHKQSLQILIPSAVIGVIVGAFTFRYLSEDAVRILIAIICLVFCAHYYYKLLIQKTEPPAKPNNPIKGSFWGAVGGFTSFGIHAGGPPVSIYMLPLRLEKKLLMGTFALFFGVVNIVKLIPYAWLGQLNYSTLTTSLALLPLAPIGVRLGYYVLHKVSEKFIYQISYFFLVIVGIKLMYQGIIGITAG